MKAAEKIRGLFVKSKLTVGQEVDNKIMSDALKAFEKSRMTEQSMPRPNILRTIARGRITKLAVAAVMILAVGLLLTYQGTKETVEIPEVTKASKSPAELTTLASLSFAYRRGGMEMVEQVCDKALDMAGPRPVSISMKEFFEEFNGEKVERKEL